MPTASVTVRPNDIVLVSEHLTSLRQIIAKGMSTRRKRITPDQVSIRLIALRTGMPIAPVEIEIVGHTFLHRLRGLDQRARRIADASESLLQLQCSCWITLGFVGYAPGGSGRQ